MRSVTLDVKVWEPTILDLFRNLGNAYCNGVWEGLLHFDHDWYDSLKHNKEVKCVQHSIAEHFCYYICWWIFAVERDQLTSLN